MTKVYRFNSSEDMTPKESADIMQVMIVSLLQAIQQRPPTGAEPLDIDEAIYAHLSPELKKYFTETEAPNITP